MTMDVFAANYAWVVWLVLILIFITIEMVTLDLTFLMISLGSLGGLVFGLFGVPWWGQLVIAALLSMVLLLGIRPPLLRVFKRGGDPTLSNVDALLGLRQQTGALLLETRSQLGARSSELRVQLCGSAPQFFLHRRQFCAHLCISATERRVHLRFDW